MSQTNRAQIDGDDPIFFFGTKSEYGAFSQWYFSDFMVSMKEISHVLGKSFECLFPNEQDRSIKFNTAEQFMMYSKAILFNDHETAGEILFTNNPQNQKALGRSVANFNEKDWDAVKFALVEFASQAKFRQNIQLKTKLMKTANRMLVEAAPRDRIWGIGFTEKTARAMTSRKEWGQNLLGKALMNAREKLREEDEISPDNMR
jgi:ribA/ribD-fused uncharacterized protein